MTNQSFAFREETESGILVVGLRAHGFVVLRYWSIFVSQRHTSCGCRHACLVTPHTTSLFQPLWRQVNSCFRERTAVQLHAWIFDMVRSESWQDEQLLSLSRCEQCLSRQLDLPCSGNGHPDQVFGTRHEGHSSD